jgi:WhiB family transcriptional regulator, redox-sensing transcriptional regulator
MLATGSAAEPVSDWPAGWIDDAGWMDDAAWMGDAACRGADPELFFPDGEVRSASAQVKQAKLICSGCPVSARCLAWALTSGQQAGIWGGRTETERRGLQRHARYPIGS